MTKLYDTSDLIPTYPEQNPFLFDLPPTNLTPWPDPIANYDTDEFRKAALAIAETRGINPLCMAYGSPPLVFSNDLALSKMLPFTAYERPAPIPETTLPENVEFLGQIWRQTTITALFTVRVAGTVRLLKVYPERTVHTVANDSVFRNPDEPDAISIDRCEQELDGYAHLQHYGVTAKGIVPQCYGWLTLTSAHIEQILALPKLSDAAKGMKLASEPPRAILLEYFADAQPLTIDNISMEIADVVLRSLVELHSAYVLHGDVHSRNILVLPGDRIAWVDLNFSRTPVSPKRCYRYNLLAELSKCWSLLYQELLPDKRIGFRTWQPPTSDDEEPQ